MKNKRLLLCMAFLLGGILLFTACQGSREAITADTFTTEMEGLGYTIVDATDQYDADMVESVTLALADDHQIEFYVLPTSDQAKSAFSENKDTFEDNKGSVNTTKSVSVGNYGYYTQTSDGKFYVVAYIDSTMVYAVVPETNKAEVDEIITTLGYL